MNQPRLSATTVLKIVHVNINGLSSKLHLLNHTATVDRWDIICVTETHLLPKIADSFVTIPGYSLLRNDTAGSIAKHGVCVYIAEHIMTDSPCRPLPNTLSVHLTAYNVYCLLVYRPPSYSTVSNNSVLSLINDFCSDREVILLGDFNLPSINWLPDPPTASNATDHSFLDAFSSLGLHQWVREPTFPRSGNILDLVLTSESDRIGQVEVLPPIPGCDHSPTKFEYAFSLDVPNASMTTGAKHKHWFKGNYTAISSHLASVDWDFELAHLDADSSFKRFAGILQQLTDEFVPDIPKRGDDNPPWLKRPPSSLINQRHSAWLHYKNVRSRLGRRSSESFAAYSAFKSVNNRYRSFAVSRQAEYEENLFLQSKDNPKAIHTYIRRKKVGRPSVGPIRLKSGQLTDVPGEMVEVFASSFASVYSTVAPPNPRPYQRADCVIDPISFSTEPILKALHSLDCSSSMGPDNLHPLLLNKCAPHIAYPLCTIFTRSLAEGVVPDDWKRSAVIPIYKKGPRYDPLNYRPISLTSVCGKTLERIIADHLTVFLENNDILSPNQFGFRSGRSTMDQLLLVYDHVSKCVDEGGVIDVILFDFSKAFDVVVHSILISKLKCIGVDGNILHWIHSFLTSRYMRVSINGELSKTREVLSGVPQGSVLGPLLFLIYINSIGAQLACNYKIFADDLKVYACVNHPTSSTASRQADVQRDIDELHFTADSWGLHMNVAKCVVLRFPRSSSKLPAPTYILNGNHIPHASSAKDLGVLVDTDLKFHDHVRSVTHRAGGLAYSFLKSTVCRSPKFMLFLLTTHIRPAIEYCSCIWNTGYVQDLKLLESVQRRWTKRISGMQSLSYGDRLRALNLYSVQGRLLRADLIQCWKIFHGKSIINPDDLFLQPPQSRTRGHCYKIFPSTLRTDVRKRSFSRRCIPVWNSLSAEAVCADNVSRFKEKLDSELNDSLYCFS